MLKLTFRSLPALIFVFLASVFLSSCDNQKVEGKVIDITGKGIEGVLVELADSKTMAETNATGFFSIRLPAPDAEIKFSKTGFTTHKVKVTLVKNETRKLEPMLLYPIPEKEGIFYLDKDSLKELTSENLIQIRSRDALTHSTSIKVFTPEKSTPTLNSNEILFIDTSPLTEKLARTKGLGIVLHSVKHYSFGEKTLYNGFQNKLTFTEVGEEKLRVLKARLKPGNYTWLGFDESNFNHSVYDKNIQSHPFSVETITPDTEKENPKIETASSSPIDYSK